MVKMPEDYRWSSYCARMKGVDNQLLDIDSCYGSLGLSEDSRRKSYSDFVRQGISESEKHFLDLAFQRNQLTGNSQFVDEVEQRVGIRIETRGRGRPSKLGK
jgi:putative transposase